MTLQQFWEITVILEDLQVIMQRKDHGISNRSKIRPTIRKAKVCRQGCADNGRPCIVPAVIRLPGGGAFIHSAHEGAESYNFYEKPSVLVYWI